MHVSFLSLCCRLWGLNNSCTWAIFLCFVRPSVNNFPLQPNWAWIMAMRASQLWQQHQSKCIFCKWVSSFIATGLRVLLFYLLGVWGGIHTDCFFVNNFPLQPNTCKVEAIASSIPVALLRVVFSMDWHMYFQLDLISFFVFPCWSLTVKGLSLLEAMTLGPNWHW